MKGSIHGDKCIPLVYEDTPDIMEEGDERSDYPVIVCDYMFNNTPFLRSYFKNRKSISQKEKDKICQGMKPHIILSSSFHIALF